MSAENRIKKGEFIKKIYDRLSKYQQILFVSLTNVGSHQVQLIRRQLNLKNSELVIGKNTIIRKAITMRMNPLNEKMEDYSFYSQYGAPMPELAPLLDLCRGKVGLIFTDEAANELKPVIESNKVQTAARVGMLAPIDVCIPPGPSGMDPSQIGFFHALHISTKINKGQIEIVKEVKVCTKGVLVGNSEAVLLKKLDVKPFQYGMTLQNVYAEGSVIAPEIVSLTSNDLLAKFSAGVNNITALSMSLGIPNELTVPHMVVNAFKNLAALSLGSGYKIDALDQMQSASSQQQATAVAGAVKNVVAEVEKEEVEEEEDMDMGGLFD
jgi:large subunit ribosomal protein LP0